MSDNQPSKKVSLDSVEQALMHWRANKDKFPSSGIPDNLWLQIFSLENPSRSGGKLRKLFGLNSQQYKKKHAQLMSEKNGQPATAPATPPVTEPPASTPDASTSAAPSPFAEVCVESNAVPPLVPDVQATQATLKTIKNTHTPINTFLDPTTVVIECIRQDGQRLKIHTRTQAIDSIVHTFYQGAPASTGGEL